ncbi:hypothetical protein KSZ_40360 [Dictyobacter formicarum]|uniref:Uncharacterized protein n=1 Tax=Dictyobacter formicarum TaxID=2778368 RepID=A0ABQ3VIK4_9CHLR|nr:hypothetical protein KSZ_40360 [Dictyobacter formicarum]
MDEGMKAIACIMRMSGIFIQILSASAQILINCCMFIGTHALGGRGSWIDIGDLVYA